MLIMEQKKRGIVNINSVKMLHIGAADVYENGEYKRTEYSILASGTMEECLTLGRYKNEARAKEILWEIFMRCAGTASRTYEMPET